MPHLRVASCMAYMEWNPLAFPQRKHAKTKEGQIWLAARTQVPKVILGDRSWHVVFEMFFSICQTT